MSNRRKSKRSAGREIQRYLIRELRRSKKALENGTQNRQSGIHRSRQCLKKVRAVLELLRQEVPYVYRVENQTARKIAKSLSEYRDGEAMIETLESIRDNYAERLPPNIYDSIGLAITSHRDLINAGRANAANDIASAIAALDAAARRLRLVSLDRVSIKSLIAARARSQRRMREARKQALQGHDPALFHRWRRRTKTLFYQEQFFRKLRRSSKRVRRHLKTVGNLLGYANDAALLNSYLERIPDSPGTDQNIEILRSLAEDQHLQLRSKALAATARALH